MNMEKEHPLIHRDRYTDRIVVDMDAVELATTLREDELMRIRTTGHDYDFVASAQNLTEEDIVIEFCGKVEYLPTLIIKANDWIGIQANDEGYEILEALVNNRFRRISAV